MYKNPAANAPMIFTASVPHGNIVPQKSVANLVMPQRNKAPAAPESAVRRIIFIYHLNKIDLFPRQIPQSIKKITGEYFYFPVISEKSILYKFSTFYEKRQTYLYDLLIIDCADNL